VSTSAVSHRSATSIATSSAFKSIGFATAFGLFATESKFRVLPVTLLSAKMKGRRCFVTVCFQSTNLDDDDYLLISSLINDPTIHHPKRSDDLGSFFVFLEFSFSCFDASLLFPSS
jgi:hypothetical protein